MQLNLLALILFGLLTANVTPLAAQSLEWIHNPTYRIKYKVPTDWAQVRQANDTMTLVTHVSPANDMMLFIGKFRGAAAHFTPEKALDKLLADFGVNRNRIFPTKYNGISFLETTGSGVMNYHPVQYDAMAATHRGNVILVYVYASPEAYEKHKPMMAEIVHSLSPYRGK